MKRNQIAKWTIKLGLFVLILAGGTVAALAIDEATGLALTELPNTPVQAVAGHQNDAVYATLNDSSTPAFYRSYDQGDTWEALESNLNPASVTALAIDPQDSAILYAGTEGGPVDKINNVWRSFDGGESWQNFNMKLPAGPDKMIPAVTTLEVDPNQPYGLYVGTAGHGVYRFDENQVGYTLVGGVTMPAVNVHDLVIDANSRLYALTGQGLFSLEGEAWQQLNTLPGTPVELAIAPLNPQIIFASVPPNGIYRSEDGGYTWEHTVSGLNWTPGSGLRATALAIDPKNPAHVVAATAYELGIHHLSPGGIFESQTGGESWNEIADTDTLVTDLNFTPDGILAATDEGLRRYETSSPAATGNTSTLAKPVVDEFDSLFPLSGLQILIFLLTLSLAGWVLIGRFNWFRKQRS